MPTTENTHEAIRCRVVICFLKIQNNPLPSRWQGMRHILGRVQTTDATHGRGQSKTPQAQGGHFIGRVPTVAFQPISLRRTAGRDV